MSLYTPDLPPTEPDLPVPGEPVPPDLPNPHPDPQPVPPQDPHQPPPGKVTPPVRAARNNAGAGRLNTGETCSGKDQAMKRALLSLPLLAAAASIAVAQTDATDTPAAADETGMFGTNWPLSVGTTFFADEGTTSLRADGELKSGWTSLSQEDRDMITSDCALFMATHGDMAAGDAADGGATGASGAGDAAASGAAGDGSAEAGSDAAGAGDAGAASTGGTGTMTGAENGAVATTGYDLAQMKAICGAVQKF